jgi:trans-aconitate 2-methyltransferase
VHRIELDEPARIADLGCGTGTSTAALAERWSDARLLGVDSSRDMLAQARDSATRAEWLLADLAQWEPSDRFDLVFSNAALQWLPEHRTLLPRLFRWVASGGALAFQVPARPDPPPAWLRVIQQVRSRDPWRRELGDVAPVENVLPLAQYDAILGPLARRIDLWDTEYDHVLEGPDAVVEWIRGTALRPWLARLPEPDDRDRFLTELSQEMTRAYPPRANGKVLFPFLRRFVIAYR